jgi:hypothetical protein
MVAILEVVESEHIEANHAFATDNRVVFLFNQVLFHFLGFE